MIITSLCLFAAASAKPLQVIIMAGQSNMVGHGYAEGSNLHWNATATGCGGTVGGCVVPQPNLPPNLNGSLLTPEYAFLRTASNDAWATHTGVWVVYNESSADAGLPAGFPNKGPNGGYWHGELSVGYGGVHKGLNINGRTNRTEAGPELGFGWTLGNAYGKTTGEQVLLIKTAWGGKTIDIDFRPPSSAAANKTGPPVGPYYLWMVREVTDALSRLGTLFPAYSGSYEIAGFVWHQGWNDACGAGGANPANYELDLANLIQDLRTDLKAPAMKAVVGTSGMCGFPNQQKYPTGGGYQHCRGACATLAGTIIPAQLAVGDAIKYPKFDGNVASVELRGFHFDMEQSSGNQCYHWNNNAQSYWLSGQAMANAYLELKRANISRASQPTPGRR